VRLSDDARQPLPFGFSPGNHDRTGLDYGKVEPLADLQVLRIAGLHALQLETAGRGVETGVQEGAVALARPGEDVRAFLQQDAARATQRQAARDGAADDAGADDRHVEGHLGARNGKLMRTSETESGADAPLSSLPGMGES
jgi:hypothetical protein